MRCAEPESLPCGQGLSELAASFTLLLKNASNAAFASADLMS
jgi:hypothetical protein